MGMRKGTLGKQHKIKADDLRFAARVLRCHVTGNKPEQIALTVKTHRDSLFELIKRIEMAAAYEEQSGQTEQ